MTVTSEQYLEAWNAPVAPITQPVVVFQYDHLKRRFNRMVVDAPWCKYRNHLFLLYHSVRKSEAMLPFYGAFHKRRLRQHVYVREFGDSWMITDLQHDHEDQAQFLRNCIRLDKRRANQGRM